MTLQRRWAVTLEVQYTWKRDLCLEKETYVHDKETHEHEKETNGIKMEIERHSEGDRL